MPFVSAKTAAILACPACLGRLDTREGGAECEKCRQRFAPANPGQLDLRLATEVRRTCSFSVGRRELDPSARPSCPIPLCRDAQLEYDSIPISPALRRGNRITRQLLSHFPRNSSGIMLDLGCGQGELRQICHHTEMEYVGIDFQSRSATLLADAHALPFRDESIDFVVSLAVLEHLYNPQVALREVIRVLKPGSLFIGTVAFLEPFHMDSYFHFSPIGTHEALKSAGLNVCYLEPNSGWQAMRAIAEMGLFPHAPRMLAAAVVLPVDLLHRLWWAIGYRMEPRAAVSEEARRNKNAGGFRFICRKPSAETSVDRMTDQTDAIAAR
jgi:SAM-dependent methyltransferase